MNSNILKNKPTQPVIKIEMGRSDIIIESIIWALLLGSWAYIIVVFKKLPEHIPSHINSLGEPTEFKNRIIELIHPTIGTLIVIVLSLFNQKPHIFNYPVNITEGNARNQYSLGVKMIRTLKLCITIEYVLISVYSSQISLGNIEGLGKLSIIFTPFLMVLIIGPIIYYIVQMYRYR